MIDRRKPTCRRSGNDRRDYQRNQLTTEVSFLRSSCTSDLEPLSGVLCDVSPNGIRILTKVPLNIGESLLIEVYKDNKRLFNSTSKVIWQEQDGTESYSTGCELCALLSPKQEKVLNAILNRNRDNTKASL